MDEIAPEAEVRTHCIAALGCTVVVGGATFPELLAAERLLAARTAGLQHGRGGRELVRASVVGETLALLAGEGFVSAADVVAVRGCAVVGLPGGGVVSVTDTALATRRSREAPDGVSRTRWSTVTVAASTPGAATVAAAVALLCGEDGPAWLDSRGLGGRFLNAEGVILENAEWGRQIERRDGVGVSI